MKRIRMGIKLLTLLAITSCNQNSTDQTDGPGIFEKEVFTFYSKTEQVVHTARVLTTDDNTFDLLCYDIAISTPERAVQTFISREQITEQQLEAKRDSLQKTYTWTPFTGNAVLFVQIQPAGFKDDKGLLEKRQEIEVKLNVALQNKNLGEWTAGDLGPGGGNMLYTVTDIDQALQVILRVLIQNNLEKNTVIGRRVLIDPEEWFYEVLYPADFSGVFNTM